MTSLPYLFLVVLEFMQLEASRCAERIRATEAYQEMNAQFPNSLAIQDRGCSIIEFCPDNTCDIVRARRSGHPERLMEFLYLYAYWFSEYFVLEEWRARKGPSEVAARILRSSQFKACRGPDKREEARCALRLIAEERNIALADVRYDEKARHERPKELP